jgi:hypothetical protein
VAALSYACALGDVFKASGTGVVSFVTGDTVVTRGQVIRFRIELRVDGAPASTPTVRLVIPDSTRIRFNATRDSISGLQVGFGNVVASIETSLAPRVDTTLRVRVRP